MTEIQFLKHKVTNIYNYICTLQTCGINSKFVCTKQNMYNSVKERCAVIMCIKVIFLECMVTIVFLSFNLSEKLNPNLLIDTKTIVYR